MALATQGNARLAHLVTTIHPNDQASADSRPPRSASRGQLLPVSAPQHLTSVAAAGDASPTTRAANKHMLRLSPQEVSAVSSTVRAKDRGPRRKPDAADDLFAAGLGLNSISAHLRRARPAPTPDLSLRALPGQGSLACRDPPLVLGPARDAPGAVAAASSEIARLAPAGVSSEGGVCWSARIPTGSCIAPAKRAPGQLASGIPRTSRGRSVVVVRSRGSNSSHGSGGSSGSSSMDRTSRLRSIPESSRERNRRGSRAGSDSSHSSGSSSGKPRPTGSSRNGRSGVSLSAPPHALVSQRVAADVTVDLEQAHAAASTIASSPSSRPPPDFDIKLDANWSAALLNVLAFGYAATAVVVKVMEEGHSATAELAGAAATAGPVLVTSVEFAIRFSAAAVAAAGLLAFSRWRKQGKTAIPAGDRDACAARSERTNQVRASSSPASGVHTVMHTSAAAFVPSSSEQHHWWEVEDGRHSKMGHLSRVWKALGLPAWRTKQPHIEANRYLVHRHQHVGLIPSPGVGRNGRGNANGISSSSSSSDRSIWSSSSSVVGGVELGVWMFVTYAGQAMGLLSTKADDAALILTVSVVLVPFLEAATGAKLHWNVWLATLLACTGLILLEGADAASGFLQVLMQSLPASLSASLPLLAADGAAVTSSVGGCGPDWAMGMPMGHVWCLVGAVGSAIHVVRSEQLCARYSPLELVTLQLGTTAVLGMLWVAAVVGYMCLCSDAHCGGLPAALSSVGFAAMSAPMGMVLLAGPVGTGLCEWLELEALQHLKASTATLILTSSPLWSSLIAYLVLGEIMSPSTAAGALLILLASLEVQLLTPHDDHEKEHAH